MVKSTAYLTLSKILTFLATLVCNKLLVNMFNTEAVGTYQQLLTVISFDAFVLFGLPDAIIYFFSGKKTEHGQSIKKTIYFITTIISAAAFILVFMGIDGIAWYFENSLLTEYRLQLAIMFFASIFGTCFPSICVVYDKVKYMVFLTTANSLLKVIIFVCVFLVKANLAVLINLLMILSLAYLACQVLVTINIERHNTEKLIVRDNLREILSYSLPLFLTTIIGKLTVLTDKLMIGWFFNTETYATYAVAARDLPYTMLTASLIAITTPKMIKYIKENRMGDGVALWKSCIKYSSIFIMFAVASNIVVCDELITFLYSKEYLVSRSIFIVYLFALIPRIAYWGIFAKSANKPVYILRISIIELILNFALNLILLNFIGVIGAAIATVLSSYTGVLMWMFINRKITGYKIRDMVPWMDLAKTFIINLMIGVAMYFLKMYTLDKFGVPDFAKLAIIAIVWGSCVLLIFKKDVRSIASMWKNEKKIPNKK